MFKVSEVTGDDGSLHLCRTCRTQFIVPENETAVCCPVCRMNRIQRVE